MYIVFWRDGFGQVNRQIFPNASGGILTKTDKSNNMLS